LAVIFSPGTLLPVLHLITLHNPTFNIVLF